MAWRRRDVPRGTLAPTRRFYWVQLAVVAAFVLLAGRLWQLQVLSGEHYFRKTSDNFVKEIDLPAARGQIRDRKGQILAENRPAYSVYVTPRFTTDPALDKLRRYLKLSDEKFDALKARITQKRGPERLRQMLAFDDIGRDELAILESERAELPGVSVVATAHRHYPFGSLAAHAIGYMNQISGEELSERKEQGYHSGDFVGRAGLERQWESFLRGTNGTERIIVDAKGQRKLDVSLPEQSSGEERIEAVPGHHVVATIDLDLQRATEDAIRKHPAAAAAVVEVDSGRVLALASWPAPDPNRLTGGLTREEAERLSTDPRRPLVDKNLRENYFPGSTFKIVPMLAALADRSVDPSERVKCTGALTFGKRAFHCVESHGPVDLDQALSQSCNVYFYKLGDHLGLDRMAEVAEDLGFGASTGLGINGEVAGFIPTMEYYKKQGNFQKGFVLNTAIGQGSVKVTVMQLAMAYAALANGGKLFVPLLVDRIETASGKVLQAFEPRLRRMLASSPESLARTRHALDLAVNHEKGTSYASRLLGIEVAGKTGTAQTRKNRRGEGAVGDVENDHAWFASFAPVRKPEIAIVVLVEHGGFGAKAATPTAMEVFKAYFRLKEGRQLADVAAPKGGATP